MRSAAVAAGPAVSSAALLLRFRCPLLRVHPRTQDLVSIRARAKQTGRVIGRTTSGGTRRRACARGCAQRPSRATAATAGCRMPTAGAARPPCLDRTATPMRLATTGTAASRGTTIGERTLVRAHGGVSACPVPVTPSPNAPLSAGRGSGWSPCPGPRPRSGCRRGLASPPGAQSQPGSRRAWAHTTVERCQHLLGCVCRHSRHRTSGLVHPAGVQRGSAASSAAVAVTSSRSTVPTGVLAPATGDGSGGKTPRSCPTTTSSRSASDASSGTPDTPATSRAASSTGMRAAKNATSLTDLNASRLCELNVFDAPS